jgi:hypothetical protein
VQFSGPGSWAREPEQLLTEGGLEKPCLDGLLVVVLANHSNAVITKQQSRSLQRGLRNRRKKQPAPRRCQLNSVESTFLAPLS